MIGKETLAEGRYLLRPENIGTSTAEWAYENMSALIDASERCAALEAERDSFGEMLATYEPKFKALRARLYDAEDENAELKKAARALLGGLWVPGGYRMGPVVEIKALEALL